MWVHVVSSMLTLNKAWKHSSREQSWKSGHWSGRGTMTWSCSTTKREGPEVPIRSQRRTSEWNSLGKIRETLREDRVVLSRASFLLLNPQASVSSYIPLGLRKTSFNVKRKNWEKNTRNTRNPKLYIPRLWSTSPEFWHLRWKLNQKYN